MYYRRPFGMAQYLPEFDQLRRNMDELMDGYTGQEAIFFPALNIWSNEDKVVVTGELPGLKAEELELSVRGNVLTLHGKPTSQSPTGTYHRKERKECEWYRTFELPCDVDADKVEARLEKGILAVALSRAEADKPRRIDIKAS
jgi:HSP20 family protein